MLIVRYDQSWEPTLAKASFSSLVISWLREYNSCRWRVVTSRRFWVLFLLELWITLKDSYWWKSEACGQAGTSLGFPKFPPSFCCSWLLPSCFLSHRCLCLFPLSLLWNWCTYPDLQTWCVSFVISTEGALRLLTTLDNHPIQPIPSVQPTKPL